MNADDNLQMAGLLFSTVESAKDKRTIRKTYGDDIANLVITHNRYMRDAWRELEKKRFTKLAKADFRQQMLALANVVVLQQHLLQNMKQFDEKIWMFTDVEKWELALYLSNLQDALWVMQYYEECEKAYWEMVNTYKDLFVKYYFDEENEMLFQYDSYGEVHYRTRNSPEWLEFTGEPSPNIRQLERKVAEKMEDIWEEPFWEMHKQDIVDGIYEIFSSPRRYITFKIHNEELIVACEDFGDECKSINGKDEYEFYYELDNENTHRFLTRLRIVYGYEKPIADLLKKIFGYDNGTIRFVNFCKKQHIITTFYSF